jgi:hypothetical protein
MSFSLTYVFLRPSRISNTVFDTYSPHPREIFLPRTSSADHQPSLRPTTFSQDSRYNYNAASGSMMIRYRRFVCLRLTTQRSDDRKARNGFEHLHKDGVFQGLTNDA